MRPNFDCAHSRSVRGTHSQEYFVLLLSVGLVKTHYSFAIHILFLTTWSCLNCKFMLDKHVELTCFVDPVHTVLGLSLAAAQAIQLSASERNNGWPQFDPWAELWTNARVFAHISDQALEKSACARCRHALPERTRAVRPFRSSVHNCQSSALRHQNGDQNHMTRYTLHVDASVVSIWKKAYRPIPIWGQFISADTGGGGGGKSIFSCQQEIKCPPKKGRKSMAVTWR